MPSVASALLAMTLQRPVTDAGVWLEAPPPPGTVVTAPVRLAGETQAPEGVLSIRLYAVQGTTLTEVASTTPAVPVGTIRFAFTWAPAAPGTYTLRVVSTTALRGFSAEVPDLVVPAKPVVGSRPQPPREAAPRTRRAPAPAERRASAVTPSVARRVDDSGKAFGRAAPTLPYAPVVVTTRSRDVVPAAAPDLPEDERRGWASVAGGLLLLLVCSHLHRSLRPQPVPKGTR